MWCKMKSQSRAEAVSDSGERVWILFYRCNVCYIPTRNDKSRRSQKNNTHNMVRLGSVEKRLLCVSQCLKGLELDHTESCALDEYRLSVEGKQSWPP